MARKQLNIIAFNPKNLDQFDFVPCEGLHVEKLENHMIKSGFKTFTTSLEKGTQRYFAPHLLTGNKLVSDFLEHCKRNNVNTAKFWNL